MPPVTLIPDALATVAEVQAILGVTGDEVRLTAAINAGSTELRNATRGPLIHEAATERYTARVHESVGERPFTREGFPNANSKYLYLRRYPIVSVASVVDESPTPQGIAATDYYVHKAEGYLEHFTVWPTPYQGQLIGEWLVTYTAGFFAGTASVDWAVKDALAELVQIRTSSKGSIASLSTGTLSVSFKGDGAPWLMGASLPPSILRKMSKYMRNTVS